MILFDLDGTLIDSNGVWADVDRIFLERRGKVSTDEYAEFVSHSIFPIAAEFTKEYYGLDESPEEIMAEWHALARDAYAHQVPLKPGVREYLDRCLESGERMALFTASVPELARLAVTRLGLDRYFYSMIFAQELGMEKSTPGAFLIAIDQLGGEPESCTVFEDSPRNCSAALIAGFTVVGVYDPYYAHVQQEVMENSSWYITSFEELL